jgi:hypothetical protein
MRRVGEVLVALSLLTIGSTPALMKSCGGGGMGHYEARMDRSDIGTSDSDRVAYTYEALGWPVAVYPFLINPRAGPDRTWSAGVDTHPYLTAAGPV